VTLEFGDVREGVRRVDYLVEDDYEFPRHGPRADRDGTSPSRAMAPTTY